MKYKVNMEIKNTLKNIEEDILNWTFCKSTFLFVIIVASWILYSVNIIPLEWEANIILSLLIAFAAVQLFSNDDSRYSIRYLYRNCYGKIIGKQIGKYK